MSRWHSTIKGLRYRKNLRVDNGAGVHLLIGPVWWSTHRSSLSTLAHPQESSEKLVVAVENYCLFISYYFVGCLALFALRFVLYSAVYIWLILGDLIWFLTKGPFFVLHTLWFKEFQEVIKQSCCKPFGSRRCSSFGSRHFWLKADEVSYSQQIGSKVLCTVSPHLPLESWFLQKQTCSAELM